LVENWKENVVYLIRYPRISSLPDLDVNCFKLEIWLKLKEIQFYVCFILKINKWKICFV